MKNLTTFAPDLVQEIDWFTEYLRSRINAHFQKNDEIPAPEAVPVPEIAGKGTPYADFVAANHLSPQDRLVLMLSMLPYVRPALLDFFFAESKETGKGYTEFGGVKGNTHAGFIPTAETAIFLIAGGEMSERLQVMQMFGPAHVFARNHLLGLQPVNNWEPWQSGVLVPSKEVIDLFVFGEEQPPEFSREFPATQITTPLDWDDLILQPSTQKGIDEILAWMKHGEHLMEEWKMAKKIKPGYRSLFYGPPGTGKTLTAALLGKSTGRKVYRVDLSMVVSKYIGETEKNLKRVFDHAENKNWILFFDEADALFGKRTEISDSKDRFANQEVSYLLQRVEGHNGTVILATNAKQNLDDAFARRFQSIINFPLPRMSERRLLWNNAFPEICELEESLDIWEIAEKFELSGGAIINVSRYASLMALNRGTKCIARKDVLEGIKKEFAKEGKVL